MLKNLHTLALSIISGVACIVAMSVFSNLSAQSQQQPLLSSSYITPFPQTDRYQIQIIGDWLGSGLASGLQDAFKQDSSVQITNNSQSNYGLVRLDRNDLMGDVDRILSGTPIHIAVIMLGINDKVSIRTENARFQPGSQEWKDAYGRDAEKLIKKLKTANIAIYWVGLPIMANASTNETIEAINDTVRQVAYLNGVKFIDTWTGFTDQLGNYSAYGSDLTGQNKRLRETDGIGLTSAGNRKLANYVEIVIRRDLVQARQQRNIPLAGDEEEQIRVVPTLENSANASATKPSVMTNKQIISQSKDIADPNTRSAGPSGVDVDAQKSKSVQKTASSDTPIISVSEPGRQDQAAFSSGLFQGEMILNDLGDGLTSIAVISSTNDFSVRDLQRQTPLADRLYYKILSKGDALAAKDGRADDFKWSDQNQSSQ